MAGFRSAEDDRGGTPVPRAADRKRRRRSRKAAGPLPTPVRGPACPLLSERPTAADVLPAGVSYRRRPFFFVGSPTYRKVRRASPVPFQSFFRKGMIQ